MEMVKTINLFLYFTAALVIVVGMIYNPIVTGGGLMLVGSYCIGNFMWKVVKDVF
jgi:hypothetical protein